MIRTGAERSAPVITQTTKEREKTMFIDQNTISTIRMNNESGNFTLQLYENKKEIYRKEYRTFTGAKIAETKLNNKRMKEGKI